MSVLGHIYTEPNTSARFGDCFVINYVDYRGIYCHVFFHVGDKIQTAISKEYTVTGLTQKGITITDGQWNLGEVGYKQLISYFKHLLWTKEG